MGEDGLNARIKQIRKGLQKSQATFAEELNITQGNLSLIESGKTILNLETLRKLKSLYGFSYSWIIEGMEDLHGGDDLIPMVDKSAMAGYPANHSKIDYIKSLSIYRVPGFKEGNYRIFEIEGESMLPTFLPHDHVISVKIDKLDKMVDGALCVIVLKDAVLIKRLYKSGKNKLTLESDNLNYKSIEVSIMEVKEVWGVQAKLTQSLEGGTQASGQKLEEIKNKLDKMQKQLDAFQK